MPNQSHSESATSQWLRRGNSVRRASTSEASPSSFAGESLSAPRRAIDDIALVGPRSIASGNALEDALPLHVIANLPPPEYTRVSLNTNIVNRPTVVVHSRDLSPVSAGSLPDYDVVSPGPPTDMVGYYNYLVPGMEIAQTNPNDVTISEIWDDQRLWVRMPFVTDPSLPSCPGIYDGSCPAARLGSHNSGPYYHRLRSPSAIHCELFLENFGIEHLFEGGNPPDEIWRALILRARRQDNDFSEDLLFRFRWYHCLEYRARVIARRQSLDVTHSAIYLRRQRRHFLRGIGALPERTDLPPIEGIEEDEASYIREAEARNAATSIVQGSLAEEETIAEPPHHNGNGASSSPVDLDDFFPNSALEISIQADSDSPIRTTELTLPADTFDYRAPYLRYGFMPPAQPAPVHGTIPTYPLCTSRRCPLVQANIVHRQGPYRDPAPFSFMAGNGPQAALRAERIEASLRSELRQDGLGALFPDDCVPPVGIWLGVVHATMGMLSADDLEYVERFRHFHCRGMRVIVEEGEELEPEEGDGGLSVD